MLELQAGARDGRPGRVHGASRHRDRRRLERDVRALRAGCKRFEGRREAVGLRVQRERLVRKRIDGEHRHAGLVRQRDREHVGVEQDA